MKLETLDALSDSELQAVIAQSEELLKRRGEERKAKALSEARALLASVGLSLKDIAHGRGKPAPKAPVYKAGLLYQHPSDKALIWNANGQKPSWLRELEAKGLKPLEIVAANDNAAVPPPVRATGKVS